MMNSKTEVSKILGWSLLPYWQY